MISEYQFMDKIIYSNTFLSRPLSDRLFMNIIKKIQKKPKLIEFNKLWANRQGFLEKTLKKARIN